MAFVDAPIMYDKSYRFKLCEYHARRAITVVGVRIFEAQDRLISYIPMTNGDSLMTTFSSNNPKHVLAMWIAHMSKKPINSYLMVANAVAGEFDLELHRTLLHLER